MSDQPGRSPSTSTTPEGSAWCGASKWVALDAGWNQYEAVCTLPQGHSADHWDQVKGTLWPNPEFFAGLPYDQQPTRGYGDV